MTLMAIHVACGRPAGPVTPLLFELGPDRTDTEEDNNHRDDRPVALEELRPYAIVPWIK